MPNLEPSYLRYVYDQLSTQQLSSDNAAALPDGFIGLYEQYFLEKTTASTRQDILIQLATYALMKDAVSTDLIKGILQKEKPIRSFHCNISIPILVQ